MDGGVIGAADNLCPDEQDPEWTQMSPERKVEVGRDAADTERGAKLTLEFRERHETPPSARIHA